MKEKIALKRPGIRPTFRLALTTALLVLIMSGAVFAIRNFLSADEYADHLEYPALAQAFKSEGAIKINKSVTDEEYKITLLGIVSGEGLTELREDVEAEKSYAVVAIEKLEGEMPDIIDENYDEVPFFVSPLVKGLVPWHINIISMHGGYVEDVINGVMYRLIECDSIEKFADRGVYLAVSSSSFYDVKAFDYNFDSSEIPPKADYDGVNVIFDLPLNKTKADPEKAQQFLDEFYKGDYEGEMKRIREAVQEDKAEPDKPDTDNVILEKE